MDDYRAITDSLASDVAAGLYRPGDRLPPQRAFARRHGIASSTAARVYSELVRRGLAVGEVGRGTFVRATAPVAGPALAEPGGAKVDLELNFSVLPEQASLLAESLGGLLRADVMADALTPVGVFGTAAIRVAAAEMMSRGGWEADPERILFTGNGRQAIAAAVSALVPVGERLGVEALTYPVVKGIAGRLGVQLVPLAMDESGVVPDALRAAKVRAVYLQPTLHNPLGTSVSSQRRSQIGEVLEEQGIFAIEDNIYGFLAEPRPPLSPERTVVVDSLSKRLAPGLTVGFLVVPGSLVERVASAVRGGGWGAQRFALEAATRWLADGTVARIEAAKRADALVRQGLARRFLVGVQGDERAYHCWWALPEPWRAETFVAAAGREGIAVSPAAAFAVVPGHAPNAVRVALAGPPVDVLGSALAALGRIARSGPEGVWES